MTNTALILVDIQNDYFPGGAWPVFNMPAAGENARRLLTKARTSGHKIIHIQHIMPSVEAPFFKPGSEGANINEVVSPKDGEVILQKSRPSSFVGTDLEKILRESGIQKLVICGAMSQMCIDSTTRQAADLGFSVTVAEDACGAKEVTFNGVTIPAKDVHIAIMGALAGPFATVVTTDKALEIL